MGENEEVTVDFFPDAPTMQRDFLRLCRTPQRSMQYMEMACAITTPSRLCGMIMLMC
jgi:hypothetical protein